MKLINVNDRGFDPVDNQNISVGSYVKIGFESDTAGERFWIEITSINEAFMVGRIDNHLYSDQWGFSLNDRVIFHLENILDIYPE